MAFRTLVPTTVIALLLSSASASAITVTILDSTPDGPGSTAHLFGAGFNATVPTGAAFDAPAPSVTGSVSGVGRSPFEDTPLEATQSYFSIGDPSADPTFASPITLTFSALQSSLTMLWGSFDRYNLIEFKDSGGTVIDAFDGDDLAAALGLPAQNRPQYQHTALVKFDIEPGDSAFESITFTSTSRAFEFALQDTPVVPVPASGLLLVAALSGLAMARRKT